MSDHHAGRADSEDDPRLAELIEEITRRLQAGESVDDADIIAAHPEFKDELTDLLPTLRLLAKEDSVDATLSADLQTGGFMPSAVLGEFRIMRELGRGGMGIVYEAQQKSLGRHVALKVLPHFGTIDNRSSRRFQNEARAAAQLDHQNIVRVHAVGFDGGVHYYAMQLVVGTDLQQVIRGLRETARDSGSGSTARRSATRVSSQTKAHDDTNPDGSGHSETRDTSDLFGLHDGHDTPANRQYVQTFARLGIQAAEALHHAHEMGIVHRDIKPSNLLLDTEGNIRVTDFGLAQIQGEAGLSVTGDIVGTLRYMSPEQAYAKRVIVDHRTDIYSLGVTLYELLTLERAFEGTSRVSLLHKIAFEDPKPPRRINKRIPVELETIVTKAMSKSPDMRYQTARQLADDLQGDCAILGKMA